MPRDEIDSIIRELIEIDAETDKLDARKSQLQESRRMLVQRWMIIKDKPATELAVMIRELAEEIKKIKIELEAIQKEKKKSSSHFRVLTNIYNAIMHTRVFPTGKEWANAAGVAYGSIFNNLEAVEKMIAKKGLKLIREKTEFGTSFRVV